MVTEKPLPRGVLRPDPWPRIFGCHEVLHALTVVGAFVHSAAIVQIVREVR